MPFADKNADVYYKEGLAYKLEGKVDKAIEALEVEDAVRRQERRRLLQGRSRVQA